MSFERLKVMVKMVCATENDVHEMVVNNIWTTNDAYKFSTHLWWIPFSLSSVYKL